MRALYLDINIKYASPTRNIIVTLLKHVFDDLDIYGPGYQEKTILNEGIKKFVSTKEKYDFVIANEIVIFADHARIFQPDSKKSVLKNFFINFSSELLNEDIILDMWNFFTTTEYKKIAYLIQTDFYNVSTTQINSLKNLKNIFYVTFGKDLICPKNELEYLYYESFSKYTTDNWFDFVNEYSAIVISLPHFVGDNEFNYTPIKDRKFKINVPGINYWFRKQVLNKVRKKYSLPSKVHIKLFSLLTKLHVNPFSYDIGNELYNYLFRKAIFSSTATFTCGSMLKWPLRKFFEIPAGGSILICYPFFNQAHLGFVNGKTCIEIADPAQITEVLDYLLKNIDIAQRISKDGQNMILKNHSLSARAYQLKAALITIKENPNDFNGANFNNATFIINKKK